jgi:uncharacterized protein (TIGR02145 family)
MKHKRKLIKIGIVILLFTLIATSCKKNTVKKKEANETGTVTDIDGNIYNTVKIGNQWWMAENLVVTKYNDSSDIFKVKVTLASNVIDTLWANKTPGAYCEIEENQKRFGYYYNWYAVNDGKKIAPKGWHIPSDDEWKQLEMELGMSQSEADKTAWRGIKERDKLIEKNSFSWSESLDIPVGNNESGFNALSVGCRLFNGIKGDGGSAYWWTNSVNGNDAWYRNIVVNHTTIFRYHTYKTYGFCVRCVKD